MGRNNIENGFISGADGGQIEQDKFMFLDGVANSGVPDKDAAIECLRDLPPLYHDVAGVSIREGEKIVRGLEEGLLGGTAHEQTTAASLIFEAKSGLEQGKKMRNNKPT